MTDTPIYDELVAELGFDPMDGSDASNDDYNLATQLHDEAMQALTEATAPTE